MSDDAIPEILSPVQVEVKREEHIINEAKRLVKIINDELSSSLKYPVHVELDEDSSPPLVFTKAMLLLLPKIKKHYTVDFTFFKGTYLTMEPKTNQK
jgi:hypothetical protein